MVKVKICGITNHRDALLAVDMGADILGFVLTPSPRQVSPEKVRSIIETLPPFVSAVGVFVDEEEKTIKDIADFCRLNQVQLHGNESPDFCRRFRPKAIKAFRLQNAMGLSTINAYRGHVQAVLLDTFQKGMAGGTGRTFPWDLAIKAKEFKLSVILSGGLNPLNVQQAVLTVKPYALDVSSGIEKKPGEKDPLLMKQLMEAVRVARMAESEIYQDPQAPWGITIHEKGFQDSRGRGFE